MSINRLYDTWYRQIAQLLAGERITRIRNFTWLVVGIQLSRSVHLNRIAAKLPGGVRLLSWSKRLSRLVDNAALQVAPIYDPVARRWLLIAANSLGQVRLIVDGTQIGLGYQLIMVSLAYRQRSLPIAWVWVKAKKGHSSAAVQLVLLAHVQQLVPVRTPVVLVGDSEFGDLKAHGFDLQHTQLRSPERLSRLTLAVVLLYLWLMFTGTQAIKNGQRQWVDRHDRRDLSVFQIGLRWFERLWINDRPFSDCLLPSLAPKLSGGQIFNRL